MRRTALSASLALALWGPLLGIRAAAGLDLGQQPFAVRTWSRQGPVRTVAQSADGFVWLGSVSGLARLDSTRLVEVELVVAELPAPYVRLIHPARDGSLWLALGEGAPDRDPSPHAQAQGGLVRLWPLRPLGAPGRLQRFGAADGLPDEWVWSLAEDRDGVLWAGTEGGLARFRDGRFERVDAPGNLPSAFVTALAPAPEGALWIGTTKGLAVRRGGRIETVAPRALADVGHAPSKSSFAEPVRSLAVAPRTGDVWVGATFAVLRLDPGTGAVLSRIESAYPNALAIDPDGNLWIGAGRLSVLPRSLDGPPVEIRGVGHARVASMTIDREGSVWAGTNDGEVAQVSVPLLRNLGAGDGVPGAYALLRARNGALFVSASGGVSRLWRGRLTRWHEGDELGGAYAFRDLTEGFENLSNHGIWIGAHIGVLRGETDGDRLALTRYNTFTRGRFPLNILATKQGDLWVTWREGGLSRFRGADLARAPDEYTAQDGLCGKSLIHGFQARDGSLWYAGDAPEDERAGATHIQDGKARCYGPADGLPRARVSAVIEDADGVVWFGMASGAGMARLRGGRTAAIAPSAGLPATSIVGLVDDDHGHLWLTTNAGVWRVPKAGLDRCADGPCPPLDAETFGKDEGMTSPDCLARFHPNVVKDEAGRVYVAQHNGVSVFPAEPPQRPVLRPLIELVAVNGKPVEIAPAIRLGRGQYDLLVRYNAPSFLRSSRRRLAHRLRGIDGAWIAAGPDATARYRDLPPGDYVLEIRAEDNSPDVAALAIAVAAPFWRTVPFFALLVALGAAVMVGVQRLRLHRLERQHRAITEERLRIARDLHDGLAQKFSAIGMLIDRARLDPRSQAVDELPRAREVLRETQSELGRAIWDMREGTEGQPRLEALLERVISQLLPPPETKIRLQTAEVSVPVSGLAAHEIPLVVKEAVTNAIRHARSKTIEVGVLSEEVGVHVWVRDDGRGMSGAGAGEGTGYGIIGMHERARRLGGTLNVRSAPGEGTQVSLYVPRASDGKPSS